MYSLPFPVSLALLCSYERQLLTDSLACTHALMREHAPAADALLCRLSFSFSSFLQRMLQRDTVSRPYLSLSLSLSHLLSLRILRTVPGADDRCSGRCSGRCVGSECVANVKGKREANLDEDEYESSRERDSLLQTTRERERDSAR